jgi:uncharacterized RDD family membrane protein YckC
VSAQPEDNKSEQDEWPLAPFPRRLGALLFDLVSGIALGVAGGKGLTELLFSSGGISPGEGLPTLIPIAVVIFGLYLGLGWLKGETLGMLVFRLRILSAADRKPIGLARSFTRGIGTALLLALGLGVFGVLIWLDNQAEFIQGAADLAIRVIAAIVGLYILWMGAGQPILMSARRQTWGDRMAGTIVAVKQH